MPTISVIVPVYKVEPYIHRCVDSILAQTFTDFELILVDDGSLDNCGAICDEYAAQDSRVRVIHKENGGVSSARNAGVSIAQGDYVTFVDSDDWIDNLYLEQMKHAVEKSNADMAVCGYRVINKIGEESGGFVPNEALLSNTDALNYYGTISNSCFRAPWNKLIRKALVSKNPFPTDRSYSEDFAVVYKWMYFANYVAGVNSELYYYFLSDTGICRSFSESWLSNFKTLEEMLSFYQGHQLYDLYEYYLRDIVQCGGFFLECSVPFPDSHRKVKQEFFRVLRKYHRDLSMREIRDAYVFLYPKLGLVFAFRRNVIQNGLLYALKKTGEHIRRRK